MPNTATLKTPRPDSANPAATADATSSVAFAMLSHPGSVRHTNQDACAALPEHSAFVVCDGVGGAAGGEIASHLAVEAFLNTLSQSSPTAPRRKGRSSPAAAPGEAVTVESGAAESGTAELNDSAGLLDARHPHARLREAVRTANLAVFQRAQKSRGLRGMATTLVAALLDHAAAPAAVALPDSSAAPAQTPAQNGAAGHSAHNRHAPAVAEEVHTLWLAHVGDSRCYRLRGSALDQLTCDHSLVEEQIRAGVLSRAEAEHSPVRNVITRAVGAMPAVEPEIATHAVQPGDLYLLASDGLTRELDDTAIARILTASLEGSALDRVAHSRADSSRVSGEQLSSSTVLTSATLEAAAHALIDAANDHGGNDNITVLLLACK